jgi:hypothetical protein
MNIKEMNKKDFSSSENRFIVSEVRNKHQRRASKTFLANNIQLFVFHNNFNRMAIIIITTRETTKNKEFNK